MTEAVVPGGTERSNLSWARDDKPDRNTRDEERHRDGDYSRAGQTHHRQFPILAQPGYHQGLSTSPPFSFAPIICHSSVTGCADSNAPPDRAASPGQLPKAEQGPAGRLI